MNKPTLTKDQAEAIESYKRGHRGIEYLIDTVRSPNSWSCSLNANGLNGESTVLHELLEREGLEIVIRAFLEGYTVEQTPEEKLAKRILDHKQTAEFYENKSLDHSERKQERYSNGYVQGASDVLHTYHIELEGVNKKL